MKLLLHACCADCTLKFIASSKDLNLESFAVYYYNPNIHPRSEYLTRLKAIQQICKENKVKLIIPNWQPQDYFSVVKSPKSRCPLCWNLRLSKSAQYAKDNGFTHLSSTLLTSHYQDSQKITSLLEKNCQENNLQVFIPSHVCKDLETKGFYKQFFCGCCHSLTERYQEKYSTS